MSKTRNYLSSAIFSIILSILLAQSGCKHSPEVFTDICFESEVLPIFQNNCTKSGCHNATDASEGIILDSYDHIMAAGITAGNAKNSIVYKSITHNIQSMPPKGKLSGSQIALIYSWIQNGAQNTTSCGFIDNSCDTANINYSMVIAPIINANCMPCHGTDSIADFSNYSSLKNYLDTNSQKLLNNIHHLSGATNMPPTGKLGTCSLQKIDIWIMSGYPNN